MSAFALADLLPDFGSRAHRPAASAAAAQPEPATSSEPVLADPSSVIAEAVAKAETAVADQLSAIYEATLQAERDNHAAEREHLQRSLGSEAAALIEARFAELERHLVALTTTAAARILGGVLSDTMRARSVEALASTIREAVNDSDALRIRVHGPQSLFEALGNALGDLAGNIEFTERPSLDLTLSIDSNLYETRLAEWSAAVAGVVV